MFTPFKKHFEFHEASWFAFFLNPQNVIIHENVVIFVSLLYMYHDAIIFSKAYKSVIFLFPSQTGFWPIMKLMYTCHQLLRKTDQIFCHHSFYFDYASSMFH